MFPRNTEGEDIILPPENGFCAYCYNAEPVSSLEKG